MSLHKWMNMNYCYTNKRTWFANGLELVLYHVTTWYELKIYMPYSSITHGAFQSHSSRGRFVWKKGSKGRTNVARFGHYNGQEDGIKAFQVMANFGYL